MVTRALRLTLAHYKLNDFVTDGQEGNAVRRRQTSVPVKNSAAVTVYVTKPS